jgi:hypothetical protein
MKTLYLWEKIVLGIIAFLSFISPGLTKGWINIGSLMDAVMALILNTLIVYVIFKIGNKLFKNKK